MKEICSEAKFSKFLVELNARFTWSKFAGLCNAHFNWSEQLLACKVGLILASECSVLSWGKLELPSDFYRSRMLGRERNLYHRGGRVKKKERDQGVGQWIDLTFANPLPPTIHSNPKSNMTS